LFTADVTAVSHDLLFIYMSNRPIKIVLESRDITRT